MFINLALPRDYYYYYYPSALPYGTPFQDTITTIADYRRDRLRPPLPLLLPRIATTTSVYTPFKHILP